MDIHSFIFAISIWKKIAAVGPTIGAISGFAGAIFTAFYIAKLNRQQREREREEQRKSLASAFIGELTSIHRIVTLRNYAGSLQVLIEHIQAGGPYEKFSVKVRRNYFMVFDENVSHLGLLPPPLPELLATVYTAMKSALEDFQTLDEGVIDNHPPQSQIAHLAQLRDLIIATQNMAKDVVKQLAVVAGREPPRFNDEKPEEGDPEKV